MFNRVSQAVVTQSDASFLSHFQYPGRMQAPQKKIPDGKKVSNAASLPVDVGFGLEIFENVCGEVFPHRVDAKGFGHGAFAHEIDWICNLRISKATS